MFVIAALIVNSMYLINAQDLQFPREMPQYHDGGGLPFSPVLEDKQEMFNLRRESFSPESPLSSTGSQRCVVPQFERIECGEPDISPSECEDISCCYGDQGCYYGKAVTLQCTRDGQFVLVVARDATMPGISLESIHMLEDDPAHCAPVGSTGSFAIYQFAVSTCGTTMKEERGFVIYENKMSSVYEVGLEPHGSIMRDVYELKFQCRFSATVVEAVVIEMKTPPSSPPPPAPHVSQQGSLQMELRLAHGLCTSKRCPDEDMYTSYYSDTDYPVTKTLREPVYVEVRMLNTTDPSITLHLEHCWTTSNPEALTQPQWDLLENGCPHNDDHERTTMLSVASSGLQFPSHYRRFIVNVFPAVDQSSLPLRIFIHCITSVCHPSETESCEPICDHTTKRVITEELKHSKEKFVVSSGELTLVSSLPVSDHLVVHEQVVGQMLDSGLWAAGALTVFALCGFTIAVLTHRLRPAPQPVPV